jgi:hypothetical protein
MLNVVLLLDSRTNKYVLLGCTDTNLDTRLIKVLPVTVSDRVLIQGYKTVHWAKRLPGKVRA